MADIEPLTTTLQAVMQKLGLENVVPEKVPYHGAEAVQTAVRAVIAATNSTDHRPM